MQDRKRFSFPEILGYTGLALICLIWNGAGWWVLHQGYFITQPRRSQITTTVSGLPSVFIAFVFIALGAIAACVILQRLNAARHRIVLAASVLIGAPAAFMLVR